MKKRIEISERTLTQRITASLEMTGENVSTWIYIPLALLLHIRNSVCKKINYNHLLIGMVLQHMHFRLCRDDPVSFVNFVE